MAEIGCPFFQNYLTYETKQFERGKRQVCEDEELRRFIPLPLPPPPLLLPLPLLLLLYSLCPCTGRNRSLWRSAQLSRPSEYGISRRHQWINQGPRNVHQDIEMWNTVVESSRDDDFVHAVNDDTQKFHWIESNRSGREGSRTPYVRCRTTRCERVMKAFLSSSVGNAFQKAWQISDKGRWWWNH